MYWPGKGTLICLHKALAFRIVAATHEKAFSHCRENGFTSETEKARSFNNADLHLFLCLDRITVRSKEDQRFCLRRLFPLQPKTGSSMFHFFFFGCWNSVVGIVTRLRTDGPPRNCDIPQRLSYHLPNYTVDRSIIRIFRMVVRFPAQARDSSCLWSAHRPPVK
jgi:hypothetical protein